MAIISQKYQSNIVNALHLYSTICISSEALFVNHLYNAPCQGRLRQCRLGFEHNTLRLLPLPPHAGTQPIRSTNPIAIHKVNIYAVLIITSCQCCQYSIIIIFLNLSFTKWLNHLLLFFAWITLLKYPQVIYLCAICTLILESNK